MVRTSSRLAKKAESETSKDPPPAKKAAAAKAKAPSKKVSKKPEKINKAAATTTSGKRLVSVEACKQWSAFKTRANKIATAVGDKARVEIKWVQQLINGKSLWVIVFQQSVTVILTEYHSHCFVVFVFLLPVLRNQDVETSSFGWKVSMSPSLNWQHWR